MGKKYDFKYIIIGSGPAGLAAALTLSKSKKRIAIVESRFLGGSNINTRDIPYQIALKYSHLYHQVLAAPEFRNNDPSVSFPNAVAHQLKAIIAASDLNKSLIKKSGIVTLEGTAHFIDNHTIAIGNKQFTSAEFILATGSSLKHSEISGTEHVNYLTPETALKVRRTPKAVLIVGGGSTGCEIASYFAELGTKVLIMETAERILPREDKEVGETISNYLTKELGVMVLPNCKVVALEQDSSSKHVIFHNGRSEKMVRVDCVVLATGSQPLLDYGLENAGIKYKNTGILIDKSFRTSAKNIYAIGDCIGGDSSTERAEYEGTLLATNLLNKAKNIPNYNGFARIVNTYQQVAVVGLNEDDLLKRDRRYKKITIPIKDSIAGIADDNVYGFIKLLADKSNHLIGATIIAPNSSQMISELSLAIRHNVSLLEIASTPHVANSYSNLIKLAAKQLIDKKK